MGAGLIAVCVAGCQGPPPYSGEPDRAETIPVTGGECALSWWLEPLADDTPASALRIAEEHLAEADVTQRQWDQWRTTLESDPDADWPSEGLLQGRAYIEVVRAEVRAALEAAGYPDTDRVIEVYADVTCSDT